MKRLPGSWQTQVGAGRPLKSESPKSHVFGDDSASGGS